MDVLLRWKIGLEVRESGLGWRPQLTRGDPPACCLLAPQQDSKRPIQVRRSAGTGPRGSGAVEVLDRALTVDFLYSAIEQRKQVLDFAAIGELAHCLHYVELTKATLLESPMAIRRPLSLEEAMRRSALCSLLFAVALGVSAPTAAFAAALFAVGPDATFVPRVLNQLPTSAPVNAAALASLGDGSIGFNGGLAYNTSNGLLYSIGNDSSGNSALHSFTTLGGNFTPISSLGAGFNGGLAYDTAGGTFYAIANDIFAASTLYGVTSAGVATALGPIGFGFYGGLTYNADDGLLYAIAGDAFGVMRSVVAIDISTAAANPLFDLGDGSLGFNGGLAYDATARLFYVIGNDFMANSTLYSFSLADSGSDLTAIGTSFGQGFLNVGLALAPEVTPPPPTVSEPPALALIGMLAVLGLARRRSSTRRPAILWSRAAKGVST